jgi:3-deoxy-manno-octulosonate cytidylyltransferase (CMP-KDO synthetase)
MAGAPRVLCVIPARFASTRLPGKPLLEIAGVPLVMWAYNRAVESGAFTQVVVATDDTRIVDVVRAHGGTAVMTASTHVSGTDRVREVVESVPCDFVVNLQGDEPDVPATLLREFVARLVHVGANSLLTCVCDGTIEHRDNPNVVKVVLNARSEALYFSRAGIPFDRTGIATGVVRHIGIYGFSREGIRRFCGFAVGALEQVEMLEQLRALEQGMTIVCVKTSYDGCGIDTPEDLAAFRDRVRLSDRA